jgi:putative ABC transport system substrate-binding protein
MNNRRKLFVALGAGLLTAPLASLAQQLGRVWRVGFLTPSARPATLSRGNFAAFLVGMNELGYVEGKNLVIERRYADNKLERLPDLAAELVQLKMDLIITVSPPATIAAQKATTTIPIVFESVGDPVSLGFVKSLAHPGGNITGFSNLSADLGPKRLEVLLDLVPKLSRVALLMNPGNSSHATTLKSVEAAAQKFNVKILSVAAQTEGEIGGAFSLMSKEKVQAVILASDPLFNQQSRQVAELAAKNRLPTIFSLREFVELGGLMSYGPSLDDLYRRAGTYADKIFKGAKPADLPVEQPTKFELFVNRKTAKAIGVKIPNSILVRADNVID